MKSRPIGIAVVICATGFRIVVLGGGRGTGRSGQDRPICTAAASLVARLQQVPARIEDLDGKPVAPAVVRGPTELARRALYGQHHQPGQDAAPPGQCDPLRFDAARRQSRDPDLWRGLSKTLADGWHLAEPVDLGEYPDRLHYRIREPDGMRTVYGLFTLDFGSGGHALLAFSSCRRFVGLFSFTLGALRVSLDPEGLELAPGETWKLEEFMAVAGGDRNVLFDRLAAAIATNHPRLRVPEQVPTGWCSWYCYGTPRRKPSSKRTWTASPRSCRSRGSSRSTRATRRSRAIGPIPSPAFGDMQATLYAIRAKGFLPALWVGPFIAERNSRVFREHPDWFAKRRRTAVGFRQHRLRRMASRSLVRDGRHEPRRAETSSGRLPHDAQAVGHHLLQTGRQLLGAPSIAENTTIPRPPAWKPIAAAWKP